MLTEEQIKQLNEGLDPNLIKQRVGGMGATLNYIPTFTAIDQANKIFGYGNWGTSVVEFKILSETVTQNKSGKDIFNKSIVATIKLEVKDCVPIIDVGFCMGKATTDADAFDIGIKGAVSDGLKRCLRLFGPQFGNTLYDKDNQPDMPATTQSIQSTNDTPKKVWEPKCDVSKLTLKCEECGVDIPEKVAIFSKDTKGKELCYKCQKK
jgi:DNA repair and recombination protein RAD52